LTVLLVWSASRLQPADVELIELIGAIYDAVIDKRLWADALERLRLRFDFEMAILAVHSLPHGHAVVQVAVNIPDDYAERLAHYNDEVIALWGGPARMAMIPVEEPTLNTSVTRPAEWATNRFYLEWARPLGVVDQVGMILARDRTLFGSLGLSIHSSRRPVSEADLEGLRLLGPHLRRAVTISRMLDVAVDTTTTFQSALEAIPTGVILVDDRLGIVHANAAATIMLGDGDPVRDSGGRLTLREELLPGQLQHAVETAARNEASLGRRGMAIPARRLDGTAVALSVFPLERRRLRGDIEGTAVAAVFIAGPAEQPSMPSDALRLLYDLTPAEQRVFALVVDGQSTGDIAAQLHVGTGTVRTQLLRVFEKTGRRNRADLVRLSQTLTPPG
jgi:DNA-binding CsgD family transcriptional regulator/PAS domain-containing protein